MKEWGGGGGGLRLSWNSSSGSKELSISCIKLAEVLQKYVCTLGIKVLDDGDGDDDVFDLPTKSLANKLCMRITLGTRSTEDNDPSINV